ncbi:MAG: universal stress protein [Desulfatiglans sp.]|jgi:nucleotide-binding universal stress UspA family protein|nr:universal stress protein [Desulfatiglans sp.]
MLLFKRILCPTDFSEPSYKALKAADDLAKEFRAELILIHVVSPMQVFPSSPGFAPGMMASNAYLPEDIASDIKKHATESLEMTVKEKVSQGVKSKTVILHGNPAEEIAKYAEESKVSVIIMGTHGLTGWRHLLLGSVTEKVARIASCPVLTIPSK